MNVGHRIRTLFRRDTLGSDAVAGLTLGVESVPDGLAGGLLAGVNPVYGLYGYMYGTFSGALATSSEFMAVQATGAMAIIVADVGVVHSGDDPDRALFTLAVLTGIVMIAAGLLKLGSVLRFVSNSVMVGFISAVGVNIVLGQLDNFTGYAAEGGNRLARAFDLLLNLASIDAATVTIGLITVALILTLERTKLGPLGMVVAIVIGSALPVLFGWDDVAQLRDIADIPSGLPLPTWPDLGVVPQLVIPALSLAFVGLVQGAGISANFPNPDGDYPDPSQDFIGQGVGNVVAGTFRGMPVGGSMSATSLVTNAGAKSRLALFVAGVVMAIIILVASDAVGYIAMPALAGLLIVVGVRTVKVDDIVAVWKTGRVQAVVMSVTFVLTLIIPLQYAVLVGVGISMILHVVRQSDSITLRRWEISDDGRLREGDLPDEVGANAVIVLQPYGSLFFAAAPVFEEQLPSVTEASTNSVVILRLRGRTNLGSTLTDILGRYAQTLDDAGSKLVLVSVDEHVLRQLKVAGVIDVVGDDNVYPSDEWVGDTVRRAHDDAREWIASHSPGGA
jgi:SulP family sulfate permease